MYFVKKSDYPAKIAKKLILKIWYDGGFDTHPTLGSVRGTVPPTPVRTPESALKSF